MMLADHPSCSPVIQRKEVPINFKSNVNLPVYLLINNYRISSCTYMPTKDVSHNNLLPRTRFPMVMWKYVFPLLQLEILVNG